MFFATPKSSSILEALASGSYLTSQRVNFRLREFGTITGLPCGAFPVGYTLDKEDHSTANKDPDWIKLIGK
uniref:Uncharacterized protein n=1 Tax=Brassica oleracea var. oleracea TaxID=109376 RepID=A0A0D3D419_BRAOL